MGWNRQRLAAVALLLLLIPIAGRVPALAALALLTVTMVALVSFEARRLAAARDAVRHQAE